jgi:hypothetical protein
VARLHQTAAIRRRPRDGCTPGRSGLVAFKKTRERSNSSIVIQLVYASAATSAFTPEALRELLHRARATNTSLDVSGMLLHLDGSFLQVLEGEPAVVNELYAKIARDRRHARVITLVTRSIAERNFPDWSMGFFDGSGRASSLAGYRAGTGFADLVGDSAAVLRIVRDFRDGRWRSLAA